MASSDDEAEELARLRQMKASRDGTVTLSMLKEQQRKQAESSMTASRYFEPVSGCPSRAEATSRSDEEDEDAPVVVDGAEIVEEPDLLDDPLRAQFPMAFGEQETKVAKPQDIHSKHRRPEAASSTFGLLRPPPKAAAAASGASFGPPRPLAASQQGSETSGRGAQEHVGPPRPPQGHSRDEEDEDMVGPAWPPADGSPGTDEEEAAAVGPGPGAADGGAADEAEEEEEDPYHVPCTHEASLSGHAKAVVALDVDHSGSRIVTGSMDYTVRIYDFNGMKSDLRSFRELEPSEGHPVHAVSWSPTGDQFLVVTGSSQAKVYDRDGHTLGEFVRGDMYIRDMRNTKGHVSGLCTGQWHPLDRFTAMTCSEDGTVRVWDTHNLLQKTVIKPTLAKPQRTAVTACAYNSDGRFIGAGLMDGTIQIWSVGGKFGASAAIANVQPPKAQMVEKQGWSYVSGSKQLVRGAHEAGSEITCLAFSKDANSLLSRSMDGTMKLWDLRKFTAPLHVFTDLPCAYSTAKCIFSPDEQLVLAGVSSGTGDEGGAVVFYERATGSLVRKVGMPATATALAWHPKLNQIFVGTGNRKAGSTHVLYDTTFSERGVLLAVARGPRKPSPFDFQPPMLIKTPHALPMFKESGGWRKRQRDKEIADALKAHKPDPGMSAGMGKQGRIGTTGGTLLTQHILKTKGKLTSVDEEMDPREAILRHAGKADEFSRFTAAYQKTQPKPIFHEEQPEEEEEA